MSGTLVQAQQTRRATAKSLPGKSRLERTEHAKHITRIDAAGFRKAVIARDGYVCRCCGCKVVATKAAIRQQLQVHHVHGRIGLLAFEDRAALVLCLWDHKRVTGAINDKLVIVPTVTFELLTPTLRGIALTDARFTVEFQKVA
jgi:hypothetical protein